MDSLRRQLLQFNISFPLIQEILDLQVARLADVELVCFRTVIFLDDREPVVAALLFDHLKAEAP